MKDLNTGDWGDVALVGHGVFAGTCYTPGVGWGRVCLDRTGIGVVHVASRFMAGESMADIARDYEQPRWKVEAAIRLFLAAGGTREREVKMRRLLRETRG